MTALQTVLICGVVLSVVGAYIAGFVRGHKAGELYRDRQFLN